MYFLHYCNPTVVYSNPVIYVYKTFSFFPANKMLAWYGLEISHYYHWQTGPVFGKINIQFLTVCMNNSFYTQQILILSWTIKWKLCIAIFFTNYETNAQRFLSRHFPLSTHLINILPNGNFLQRTICTKWT